MEDLRSYNLQIHTHPIESAVKFWSRWRDREVVSVRQSTLARWREGQDPNHSLPVLAQNHLETRVQTILVRFLHFGSRLAFEGWW